MNTRLDSRQTLLTIAYTLSVYPASLESLDWLAFMAIDEHSLRIISSKSTPSCNDERWKVDSMVTRPPGINRAVNKCYQNSQFISRQSRCFGHCEQLFVIIFANRERRPPGYIGSLRDTNTISLGEGGGERDGGQQTTSSSRLIRDVQNCQFCPATGKCRTRQPPCSSPPFPQTFSPLLLLL